MKTTRHRTLLLFALLIAPVLADIPPAGCHVAPSAAPLVATATAR